MSMRVNADVVYLNTVANQQSAELDRERASDARQNKVDKQMRALNLTEEAADKRGDAQDTQAVCNSVATGLGAAAAICACFPPIGTIVAAFLAVAAAIVAIVGMAMTHGEQQEAADIDHQAGAQNVEAEQLEAHIEEAQDSRRERRQQVQAQMQQFLQAEAESRQIARDGMKSSA